MILESTSDLVRLTNTPAADIDVLTAWVDVTPATNAIDAGSTPNKYTTTQTNATIVSSPASGVRRKVKYLCVTNIDSADSTDVTINFYDGTTSVEQMRTVTLAPQESLIFSDGTWFVYNTDGAVRLGVNNASDTIAGGIEIATQAEMESASANDRVVTPGRLQYHPGVAKFRVDVRLISGVPQVTQMYNVNSLTDTGTGRLTVTIETDFSASNWSCLVSTFTGTSAGVEGIPNIDAKAAGSMEAGNRTAAATPAFEDPATGYCVIGFGDQ